MGVLQMAESDTISKGQEKPRKSSTESSKSPKTAQPSCIRGAFVRIFLKRAEPNKTEEDQISNRNTEDQEGVRGKKRRVTGGIFRLPCLRPAETTGNDIQDKTGEQGNDIVQEEELKPYSKASFLRKIRCYRLMREKDATEKEKVVEMVQHKHDKEGAEVKQCKERVVEQNEEGLQNINQEEVVEEKGKDTIEQGSHAKGLGEAGNDSEEQDLNVEHVGEHEKSLRKQECNTGKFLKEIMKREDQTQSVGGMGKGLAEQESGVETLEENNELLEDGETLQEDKKIEKQETHIDKIEQKEQVLLGKHEGDIEQSNCEAKARALDNALSDMVSQPDEMERQEEQEEAMDKDLPKQDTEESVDVMEKYCPENKCHIDKLEESGNYNSEQEEEGNAKNNGPQHLEKNMKEEVCHKETGLQEKDMADRDSQAEFADKFEDNVLENNSIEESHAEVDGGQENNLVDKDSYTKNADNSRKQISHPGSQYLVKDGLAETVGEFEGKPVEVSEVSLDVQDDHIVTNYLPKQELTKTNMNKDTVTCQLKDSSVKKTLGSEDNEELLASIIKKTTANNILNCAAFEDVHTHVVELQKEVLTNATDLPYQEAHICVSNKDDGMGCESADLGSLKVEVQDMVEWLVQEASDRLSNYTQKTEGTG
ncbi:uncharacterized protein LOC130290637 [Hyla sarda]|uniref:uncharacterized protein LOC130290637 n=1 Tax=Hyla sarda TaxID=327740 RepID=UPI0024C37FFC|nr:uncharacterized protein LOC130290637 [Hyla sarda]